MEWEYWFLDMPQFRQGDVHAKIRDLEINGWEFVSNGGADSDEVLIFKRRVDPGAIPQKEGCLLIKRNFHYEN
ncbi:MAG: hypothetical protein ACE5E9_08055 [Nitrospinaceae bacterium]